MTGRRRAGVAAQGVDSRVVPLEGYVLRSQSVKCAYSRGSRQGFGVPQTLQSREGVDAMASGGMKGMGGGSAVAWRCGGVQEGRGSDIRCLSRPKRAKLGVTFPGRYGMRTGCTVEGARRLTAPIKQLRCGEGWPGVPDVGRWRDPPLGGLPGCYLAAA